MSWSITPAYIAQPLTITPWSESSVGAFIKAGSSSAASAAYPLANLALYIPFQVNDNYTVRKVFWITGTTSGGTVDIGVFDSAGVKLMSIGGVSRGTASGINNYDTTDLYLGRGDYYLGFSAASTHSYVASSAAAGYCQAIGICEQTSAYPLPGTATFAATTRAYIPLFGLIGTTLSV